MPSKLRLQRIGDRIRQDLSEMIVMGKIRDPRVSGIIITDVKVDRELSYAEVYLSAIEGSERAQEALQGFNSASGYIRRALAESIELRVFPRLRFHWDPTPEKADRIERLLAEIREEQPPVESEDMKDFEDDEEEQDG